MGDLHRTCYLDVFGIQGNCLGCVLNSTAIGFHPDVSKRSVCMVDSAQRIAVNSFSIHFDGQQVVLLCTTCKLLLLSSSPRRVQHGYYL